MATSNGTIESKHVAMLSTPGMGHLIPLAELAKRLVAIHGIAVTLLTFPGTSSKAQESYLASLPPTITSRTFDSVAVEDLPKNAAIETIISVTVSRHVEAIAKVLAELKSTYNLVAFVADLFAADTFDAAYEVGVPPYLFMPSNLLLLSLLMHLPEFETTITCEFRDLPEPLRLPGCVPVPGADLLSPLQDKSNECYKWMVHHGKRYWEAKAILVNTFESIEPGATIVLKEKKSGRPPVYPVGPLLRTGFVEDEKRAECLEWLDKQPAGSVIFVSFGSGGTLTTEQLCELALGLELSGQRFLWVVRSPSDESNSAYFDAESKTDPFRFLPNGFSERVGDFGFLVPSWAPQVAVLNHEATGGFLSHCGWNSTLESVVAGKAMVAWPLYAEQRQNAAMLVDGAKVALRPKAGQDGVYKEEEIARVVRELMGGEEGKAAKEKMLKLQVAAVKGLEEGGASYLALAEVANEWKGLGQ